MKDLVQCKEKMVSCYHMHQELIPSHGEKRRHLYGEMGGLVFQLTSQFGPASFGQCVDCQTVLQEQYGIIKLPVQSLNLSNTHLSIYHSQLYFLLPLLPRSMGPRAVP